MGIDTAVGGVQSVEKDMNGEHPTGFWWCRLAQTKMKRRFSGHMRSPQGLCENLINAFKLLANQQKDGDSPIQNIILGLEEKCRERITNGLRSFITSDNYSAVEVGHLRGGQRALQRREAENGWRQFGSSKRRSGWFDIESWRSRHADSMHQC